jgi:pimeloyl-ACP methyl ester carboxylesterase
MGFGLLFAQTANNMNTLPKSVVFITGTFLGNNCWDQWKQYFEGNGYRCIAPAWPHKNASPEELRNRDADHAMTSNRLLGLTDYFATIVNTASRPIIIGHSLGGLVVQLLLQRGLGSAGVAIHSFPPAGVNTFQFSFIKAVWDAMALFTSSQKTYMMSFRKWKQSVANGMNCEQQKELYYKYATPESKLLIRDAFKCTAKINFKNSVVPLLFTSGGRDRLIPHAINYINYRRYKIGDTITGYKNFKEHGHLVFDSPVWMEEAEFTLNWLRSIK